MASQKNKKSMPEREVQFDSAKKKLQEFAEKVESRGFESAEALRADAERVAAEAVAAFERKLKDVEQAGAGVPGSESLVERARKLTQDRIDYVNGVKGKTGAKGRLENFYEALKQASELLRKDVGTEYFFKGNETGAMSAEHVTNIIEEAQKSIEESEALKLKKKKEKKPDQPEPGGEEDPESPRPPRSEGGGNNSASASAEASAVVHVTNGERTPENPEPTQPPSSVKPKEPSRSDRLEELYREQLGKEGRGMRAAEQKEREVRVEAYSAGTSAPESARPESPAKPVEEGLSDEQLQTLTGSPELSARSAVPETGTLSPEEAFRIASVGEGTAGAEKSTAPEAERPKDAESEAKLRKLRSMEQTLRTLTSEKMRKQMSDKRRSYALRDIWLREQMRLKMEIARYKRELGLSPSAGAPSVPREASSAQESEAGERVTSGEAPEHPESEGASGEDIRAEADGEMPKAGADTGAETGDGEKLEADMLEPSDVVRLAEDLKELLKNGPDSADEKAKHLAQKHLEAARKKFDLCSRNELKLRKKRQRKKVLSEVTSEAAKVVEARVSADYELKRCEVDATRADLARVRENRTLLRTWIKKLEDVQGRASDFEEAFLPFVRKSNPLHAENVKAADSAFKKFGGRKFFVEFGKLFGERLPRMLERVEQQDKKLSQEEERLTADLGALSEALNAFLKPFKEPVTPERTDEVSTAGEGEGGEAAGAELAPEADESSKESTENLKEELEKLEEERKYLESEQRENNEKEKRGQNVPGGVGAGIANQLRTLEKKIEELKKRMPEVAKLTPEPAPEAGTADTGAEAGAPAETGEGSGAEVGGRGEERTSEATGGAGSAETVSADHGAENGVQTEEAVREKAERPDREMQSVLDKAHEEWESWQREMGNMMGGEGAERSVDPKVADINAEITKDFAVNERASEPIKATIGEQVGVPEQETNPETIKFFLDWWNDKAVKILGEERRINPEKFGEAVVTVLDRKRMNVEKLSSAEFMDLMRWSAVQYFGVDDVGGSKFGSEKFVAQLNAWKDEVRSRKLKILEQKAKEEAEV